MKKSQIANIYLLELAAAAMPYEAGFREALALDLLDPTQARSRRSFIMGCLKSLGYEPILMAAEAAQAARRAMRAPDPLAAAKAEAAGDPLALTDDEAALRAGGWGVAEARAFAVTANGARIAREIANGVYVGA